MGRNLATENCRLKRITKYSQLTLLVQIKETVVSVLFQQKGLVPKALFSNIFKLG